MSKLIDTAFSKEIHENNKAKGFWDKQRNYGEVIMLIVTELSEAMDAHQKGRFADWKAFLQAVPIEDKHYDYVFESTMKDTFEDEIADTIIRLLDFMGKEDVEVNTNFVVNEKSFMPINIGEGLLVITERVTEIYNLQQEGNPILRNKVIQYTLSYLLEFARRNIAEDISHYIYAKVRYNKNRPFLHGKNY